MRCRIVETLLHHLAPFAGSPESRHRRENPVEKRSPLGFATGHRAEVGERQRRQEVARIEFDRGAQMVLRAVEITLLCRAHAAIFVRQRHGGVGRERPLVISLGVCDAAVLGEQVGKFAAGLAPVAVVGETRQRGVEEIERMVDAPVGRLVTSHDDHRLQRVSGMNPVELAVVVPVPLVRACAERETKTQSYSSTATGAVTMVSFVPKPGARAAPYRVRR